MPPPSPQPPPPLPQTIPGPIVHGQPTTATLQTIAQLQTHPTLPSQLPPLINASYGGAVAANPHLGFRPGDRVPSPAAFFEQMGAHAETFVLTLTGPRTAESDPGEEAEVRLLGTATARRHLRTAPPSDSWMWPSAPRPGVCEWELKLLATDPGTQRQGVAGWVLGTMERVMLERSSLQGVVGGGGGAEGTPVRVVLTTAQQLNEAWYLKRGYVLDAARHPGGEEAKFMVADMSKVIGIVPQ